METRATYVGVQSQAGCHAHGKVGKDAHEEGGHGGDGGGGGDEVPFHFLHAAQVHGVVDAQVVGGAHARSSGIGQDGSVHGDLEFYCYDGLTVDNDVTNRKPAIVPPGPIDESSWKDHLGDEKYVSSVLCTLDGRDELRLFQVLPELPQVLLGPHSLWFR